MNRRTAAAAAVGVTILTFAVIGRLGGGTDTPKTPIDAASAWNEQVKISAEKRDREEAAQARAVERAVHSDPEYRAMGEEYKRKCRLELELAPNPVKSPWWGRC